MVLVNTDKFSEDDLVIFIESLEEISRIERLRRQRKERCRAQHLEENVNRLQHKIENNPAFILNDTDEEEISVMENTYEQHLHDNSTYIMEDQYYVVNSPDDYSKVEYDALTCYSTLYSTPVSCSASTKSDECNYETLKAFEDQYLEDNQEMKRNKAKRKLSFLGFVCKKYKKCFSSSSNSNNWHKSDSWTKLPLV